MISYNRTVILSVFILFCSGLLSAQQVQDNFLEEMEIYEQFGLAYNNEIKTYCYNDKIVGIFIDELRWNRIYTNPAGEIFIKVNRNDIGEIIDIFELTPAEYAKIAEELDMVLMTLNRQMTETREILSEKREQLEVNRNFLNTMQIPNFGRP